MAALFHRHHLFAGSLAMILAMLFVIAFFTRSPELVDSAAGDPGADVQQAPNGVLQTERSTETKANANLAFKDLTIPGLRERKYESQLGELRKTAENASYTSYLTSYSSDSLKINGLLTQPKGEAPEGGWPAIVFIHGYIPPTLYKTQERYISYVDNLAKNGFVVFKIDLRGHGSSEGEATGAYYSGDYVVDALNARAALQASEFVNPERIGFWGHSMAGNVTLRSLAVQPDIPAAVIWGGAVYSYEDMQKYGIDDNSYRPPGQNEQRQRRRQELFDTYGQFDPQSEFWKQVAPSNYLQDIKGAIQLHHAENDTVVPIGYAQDLAQKLEGTSVPHELYEYTQGGHDIEGASFGIAMQRTVAFFKKYL